MAISDTPLTRVEQYLNKAATGSGTIPEVPLTRTEQYLARIAGQDTIIPDAPLTRLEQYLDAIAKNGSSGSLPKMAEGTVRPKSNGYIDPITHNLGTQKIAALIYPEDDATITAESGYLAYTVVYINLVAFAIGNTWHLDFSSYNTNFPDVVDHVVGSQNNYPRVANGNSSPWTSQNTITQGQFQISEPQLYNITDNTFQPNSKFAQGTYQYKIWALE